MKKPFFSLNSSGQILAKAVSEGLPSVNGHEETSVEIFLRNALLSGKIASPTKIMESTRVMEHGTPAASTFKSGGLLNENQLADLFEEYVKNMYPESKDKILKNLSLMKSKPTGNAFEKLWNSLEKHERDHGEIPTKEIIELICSKELTNTEVASKENTRQAGRKLKMDELDKNFIGKKVGSSQILERIGSGGIGVVYKAKHSVLDKEVAVKIIPEKTLGESQRTRFLREARAAANLEHPNIVPVYDAGEENGYFYIVMQLVKGRTIREILEEKGAFKEQEALLIIEEVAEALKTAHKAGLVHRDLKPDNIMITTEGTVKVTDFGLVKGESDVRISPKTVKGQSFRESKQTGSGEDVALTADGVIVGTPLYMAPEQFKGAGPDKRSDIYSLGVTFYHMLAGRPPFLGESISELASMHSKMPVPPLDSIVEGIHPEIEKIVEKMLAKNPEERFENLDELIRTLKSTFMKFAEHEAKARYSYKETSPLQTKPSGNGLLIATISTIAGIAAIILISLILTTSPEPPQISEENAALEKEQLVEEVIAKLEEQRREEMAERVTRNIGRYRPDPMNAIHEMAEKQKWSRDQMDKIKEILTNHSEKVREFMDSPADTGRHGAQSEQERVLIRGVIKETHEKLESVVGRKNADEIVKNMLTPRRAQQPARRWQNENRPQPERDAPEREIPPAEKPKPR